MLRRGLSFCPRPKQVNKTELQNDLDEFGRKIIAKEIFARDEETDVEEEEPYKSPTKLEKLNKDTKKDVENKRDGS